MCRTEKNNNEKKNQNKKQNEKTACAFNAVQVTVRTAVIHKILVIEIIN